MGKSTNRPVIATEPGFVPKSPREAYALGKAGDVAEVPAGAVLVDEGGAPLEAAAAAPGVPPGGIPRPNLGVQTRGRFVLLTPVDPDGNFTIGAVIALDASLVYSVESTALGAPGARSLVYFAPVGSSSHQAVRVRQTPREVLDVLEAAGGL